MTAIIALDDKDGYTLFGKRLSRDRRMIDDIVTSFPKVYTLPGSAELFAGRNVTIAGNAADGIPDDAAIFLENTPVPAAADTLIVYRWGKHYPSNVRYTPAKDRWYIRKTEDFEGYSHPKMKKETYSR